MSNFDWTPETRAQHATARRRTGGVIGCVAAMLIAGCDAGPEKEPPTPSGTGTAGMMLTDVTGGTGGTSDGGTNDRSDEGDAPLPACDFPLPKLIAACAGIVGPGSDDVRQLTGVVQAIERPANLCSDVSTNAPAGNPGVQGYAVIISDGLVTVNVRIHLPWRTPIVRVGDTVTVSFDSIVPIESAPKSSVTMRDENGELLLWFTNTYEGLGAVAPPELHLFNGESTCLSKETMCGPVTQGQIGAAGSDAKAVMIAQGKMADVAGFVVVNGESTRGKSCGWQEARAIVAVVRGSQESLSQEWQPDEDAGL